MGILLIFVRLSFLISDFQQCVKNVNQQFKVRPTLKTSNSKVIASSLLLVLVLSAICDVTGELIVPSREKCYPRFDSHRRAARHTSAACNNKFHEMLAQLHLSGFDSFAHWTPDKKAFHWHNRVENKKKCFKIVWVASGSDLKLDIRVRPVDGEIKNVRKNKNCRGDDLPKMRKECLYVDHMSDSFIWSGSACAGTKTEFCLIYACLRSHVFIGEFDSDETVCRESLCDSGALFQ